MINALVSIKHEIFFIFVIPHWNIFWSFSFPTILLNEIFTL